jgi:hypothetical protein
MADLNIYKLNLPPIDKVITMRTKRDFNSYLCKEEVDDAAVYYIRRASAQQSH